MAQPTAGDVHVNVPLTNISTAFIQSASDFIADSVFPNIPVTNQSNRYWTYDQAYWFRSEAQLRGISSESAGSGFTVDSTPNYFCSVQAVHKDVDDQIRANTDSPLDADRDATMFVSQQMMIKRDIDWAAKFFTTGIWAGVTGSAGTDVTGNSSTTAYGSNTVKQWDLSGSDPIADINHYRLTVKSLTGYYPNVLVVGAQVDAMLRQHSLILDRIKYTQKGIVTSDLLAALFGVDKYVVASAVQNTGKEGGTAAYSFIFGKAALLLYAAPSPGLMTPSAGYTFSWNGYLGASAFGSRIKRFRMEHLSSDRIEAEMAYDMKLVAANLGVYFTTIVS
jgi:hypothetical protein